MHALFGCPSKLPLATRQANYATGKITNLFGLYALAAGARHEYKNRVKQTSQYPNVFIMYWACAIAMGAGGGGGGGGAIPQHNLFARGHALLTVK